MALLSRRLILLAILLYEQLLHYTQINLSQKHAVFEYSATYLSVIFELLPGLIQFASLRYAGGILGKTVNLNMNYSALTTMYERAIRIHRVVTSHGAGKVTSLQWKQI